MWSKLVLVLAPLPYTAMEKSGTGTSMVSTAVHMEKKGISQLGDISLFGPGRDEKKETSVINPGCDPHTATCRQMRVCVCVCIF